MAIATIILLACIGVGAAIGGTYAGVTAYNDGARGWELVGWIALGAVAGGAVGGIVGYYAGPLAASLLTSGGGLSLAGAGAAGLTMSGVMAANIVVGGSLVVSAAGALAASSLLMFAKGNGPRMGHNQYEKKQIDSLCKKYNLSKEQRRILHDYISGQNYSYHEIEQIIKELFFS